MAADDKLISARLNSVQQRVLEEFIERYEQDMGRRLNVSDVIKMGIMSIAKSRNLESVALPETRDEQLEKIFREINELKSKMVSGGGFHREEFKLGNVERDESLESLLDGL